MSNEMMRKEIQEAITAGERALLSLRAAQERLDRARGWGLVDLFGGGFITDMMKHSQMRDAASYVESAKRDLLVFQRELRDVQMIRELHIDVGGFLTFADFFFDGLVADYLVFARISDARRQINDAIYRVEKLLEELKQANGYY